MKWNHRVRQFHRWVSIAFTLTVIGNFVAMAVSGGQAPSWVTYSPLPPLFALLLTGAYLFVLPYLSRTRSREEPLRARGTS